MMIRNTTGPPVLRTKDMLEAFAEGIQLGTKAGHKVGCEQMLDKTIKLVESWVSYELDRAPELVCANTVLALGCIITDLKAVQREV